MFLDCERNSSSFFCDFAKSAMTYVRAHMKFFFNNKFTMQSCLPDDNRTVTPVLTQVHSNNVVVTRVTGLLLPEEVMYVNDAASHHGFDQSVVVGTDGESVIHSARTSRTAYLPKGDDPVLDCISARMATIASHPVAHLEPLQVTRYTHGQQYTTHSDLLGGDGGGTERTTTLFTYLDSDGLEGGMCGGATAFPYLTDVATGEVVRVYPHAGDAVMWSNRTLSGAANHYADHSGEPLTCHDVSKAGINAWFRDGPWE